MPYAKIELSGCGTHKNRAKLRLDFFLNPDDPNYDKYPDIPFHSHFIYPGKDASDADIKTEIEKCLNYFYAFHQHCWDKGLNFIDEWKKVPSRKGQVRQPFVKGSAKDVKANKAKVQNIVKRAKSFRVGIAKVPPQDLNIGEKGTIDVGSAAIDRGSNLTLSDGGGTYYWTGIAYYNSANATGEIDTVEVYMYIASPNNSIRFGTFTDEGSNYFTCHDAEEYGEVSAGYNVCTGLAIDIEAGEYIGVDAIATPKVEIEKARTITTGYSGDRAGQYCVPEDYGLYSVSQTEISLYGTGTEGGAFELSITDSISVGDSRLRSMLAGLSRADGLTSGDTNNPFGMVSRVDGLKAGDSFSLLAHLLASEGLKSGDSISILTSLLASDGLKIGDSSYATGLLLSLIVVDGIKLGDSGIRNLIIPLLVSDGTKLGDSLSILARLAISDGLKLGDSLYAPFPYTFPFRFSFVNEMEMVANLLRPDGMKLGDTATLGEAILYFAIVDGLNVGDTSLIEMLADIQASDGIKVGDAIIQSLLASLGIKDGLKLGDIELAELDIGGIALSIIEGIKIGDSNSVNNLIELAILEAIKVGDTGALGQFGRVLRLLILTTQYRKVNVVTCQKRKVNTVTTQKRKVRVITGE